MPTPVHLARQCLTPEASHALDEAVSVARRRSHAQTTSLHAVSALLSLPSSTLREACARARNSAYSPRLQFKALDLCLGVSLDRVPSGQLADEPPVSNSLMAAIKRSQANQRRQPENFHLYQQISNQSSITTIKVELQHLILSILDDPVVSRVFGEAGFRSSEIKLAILRPLPQFLRYSRARGPPLFLCNLTENPDPIRRNFSFPFPGVAGVSDADENSRRIAEVLCRTKGKNPLLVGVCAHDALQSFTEAVQSRKYGAFPAELAGIDAICIENDVARFTIENSGNGSLDSKLSEVRRAAKQSLGPGLVVNYGDLKSFVAESASGDAASYVVAQLTSLVAVHGGKVWLVGAAVSYEMYLKFVSKFPTIEKDWDLQLLPITSLKPAMAESYPRSSLMESFVPFGGFFSAPSDSRRPSVQAYQCRPRCHLCNEKCEQEVYALSKGGLSASVADHYRSSLPSWLQMSQLGPNKDNAKTQDDDGVALSAKMAGLQKKWDSICQRLHHSQQFYEDGSQFPTVTGFQFVQEKKGNSDNHSCSNASDNETKCKSPNSCVPIDLQKNPTSHQGFSSPMAKNESFLSKLWVENSKAEDIKSGDLSLSNSSIGDSSRASPTSVTSVTTDLGLGMGMFSASNTNSTEPKNASNQHQTELPQDLSGCSSANVDDPVMNRRIYINPVQTSSSNLCNHIDSGDVKMIFRALMDRVAWQKEAVSVISQTIALCQTRNGKRSRADMWFHFSGPDRSGKKKIAVALSEILYGRGENFIHLDMSSKDGMIPETSNYDDKFRGKTAVDYLAAELFKKPLSVVFLENVDKADVLVHNSLSHAVQTGKFSDTHGREVSIKNSTFVTTSASTKGTATEPSCYSEDRIVRATTGWPIQMLISHKSTLFMNKRKPIGGSEMLERQTSLEMAKRAHKGSPRYLDLNLPAQESVVLDIDSGSSDNDSLSENFSANWLQDFLDGVDERVVFEPFDFDALAERISKEVNRAFCSVFGQDCSLQVDSKVMEQLLSAGYLSDRDRVVEDWVDQVLKRGFVEVHERFDNLKGHCVVKVVAGEEHPLGDRELRMGLPSRIIVN